MSEIWWRARRQKGRAPQDRQQRDRQHKGGAGRLGNSWPGRMQRHGEGWGAGWNRVGHEGMGQDTGKWIGTLRDRAGC